MSPMTMTRRAALLSGISALGGCSAVSVLNSASQPLATYDLSPAAGAKSGRRTSRTLLIARPEAPASIAADRIMVKPDALSITYLPDARWADELPLVLQFLLIRSIAGTGRIGYVGRGEGGPAPDTALLVRIDAFQVEATPAGAFEAAVDITLTALNDRDQRVIATRAFARTARAADDRPPSIVAAFQSILDDLLPEMSDWVLERA